MPRIKPGMTIECMVIQIPVMVRQQQSNDGN
jgi:hypothetical protein